MGGLVSRFETGAMVVELTRHLLPTDDQDNDLLATRPRRFYDLAIEIALIRPGPVQAAPSTRSSTATSATKTPSSNTPPCGRTYGRPLACPCFRSTRIRTQIRDARGLLVRGIIQRHDGALSVLTDRITPSASPPPSHHATGGEPGPAGDPP